MASDADGQDNSTWLCASYRAASGGGCIIHLTSVMSGNRRNQRSPWNADPPGRTAAPPGGEAVAELEHSRPRDCSNASAGPESAATYARAHGVPTVARSPPAGRGGRAWPPPPPGGPPRAPPPRPPPAPPAPPARGP